VTCSFAKVAGHRLAKAVLCKQGVGGSSPLVSTGWSSRRKRPPRPSCRSLRQRHPIADLDRFGTTHPGGLSRTIRAEPLPPVGAASSVVASTTQSVTARKPPSLSLLSIPVNRAATDTCPDGFRMHEELVDLSNPRLGRSVVRWTGRGGSDHFPIPVSDQDRVVRRRALQALFPTRLSFLDRHWIDDDLRHEPLVTELPRPHVELGDRPDIFFPSGPGLERHRSRLRHPLWSLPP